MANFTTATPSIDQAFSDWQAYGEWRQSWFGHSSGATLNDNTGTKNSGVICSRRYVNPITVPSVTAPVTGYVITQADMSLTYAWTGDVVFGLEFLLGTLTVSGNSFSNGGSMPTRTVRGSSIQTGSILTCICPTAALTATTPTLTVTYTNQAGVTNQSMTQLLPNNANAGGAYLMNRNLAAGDTGIQAVTNLSISTGSAGVLNIYGVLPLGILSAFANAGNIPALSPLMTPFPMIKCLPGDVLNFYGFGQANTFNANGRDLYASIVGMPEQ